MNPGNLAHPRPTPLRWLLKPAAFLVRAWRARHCPRQADTAYAGLLVWTLLQAMPTYPVDGTFGPDDQLVIDATEEERVYVLPLGSGRTTWLHRLITAELATYRNARPGGTGHCEHCHGTGLASFV